MKRFKQQNYMDGMLYETLIRRSLGHVHRHHPAVGSWTEDFGTLHGRVGLAIDRFLKKRLSAGLRVRLVQIQSDLSLAYTRESLLRVIEDALEATRELVGN